MIIKILVLLEARMINLSKTDLKTDQKADQKATMMALFLLNTTLVTKKEAISIVKEVRIAISLVFLEKVMGVVFLR